MKITKKRIVITSLIFTILWAFFAETVLDNIFSGNSLLIYLNWTLLPIYFASTVSVFIYRLDKENDEKTKLKNSLLFIFMVPIYIFLTVLLSLSPYVFLQLLSIFTDVRCC